MPYGDGWQSQWMGSTQLKDTDEVCEVIVINDIICALIYKEDSVAFFFWRENEAKKKFSDWISIGFVYDENNRQFKKFTDRSL